MQKRHSFNVLAMELRLPCIKPPKLYVNSSKDGEHEIIVQYDIILRKIRSIKSFYHCYAKLFMTSIRKWNSV